MFQHYGVSSYALTYVALTFDGDVRLENTQTLLEILLDLTSDEFQV